MMLNNKKGQVDVLFVIVFVLAFIIAIFVSYNVFDEIGDVFVQDFPNVTTVDIAYGVFGTGQLDTFYRSFNVLTIIMVVMGVIAAMVLGFFSDTHPILAVVGIVLMILFTVLSAFLSNVYEEVVGIPELAEETVHFPATTFFFQHLPKFMVLATAFTIIVTFSKTRGSRGTI